MIEFGKTLREAREAKGYSVSQLAEITHILPQIIENLEKEDFTKIVAPIYGRGFVKLYCETVGIDAKPLVDEFMEIYNGNRPPTIRLREVEPAPQKPSPVPEPAPTPEPTPMPEPVSVADEPPMPEPSAFNFASVADPEPAPVAAEPPVRNVMTEPPMRKPEPPPPPFTPGPDDLPFPPDDAPAPRRSLRMPGYSMPEVPRRFWRFGILVVAAALVLALVFFGCRALYRATMRTPGDAPTEEKAKPKTKAKVETKAEAKVEAKTETPRTPRKPIAVPPLYID